MLHGPTIIVGVILSVLSFLFGLRTKSIFLDIGIFGYQGVMAAGVLLVYVYALEIYPTDCRATGTAINLASGRIGSTICALVFEVLNGLTAPDSESGKVRLIIL